jgi:type IV pilus assembly protein PilO
MAIEGFKFDEKPLWQAFAFGLGISVLLGVVLNYAVFKGMRSDIENRQKQLDTLNQEIERGRAAERKLGQFREEVKRLELELSKLLQVLPPERDTEGLIKKVEALVHQGDFSLKSFKTAEPVPKEFYKEYPINIALDGTYHNLALFFARMSNFPRIINVEDLKVHNLENIPGKTLGATFVAKTFIYTGNEETQAATAGAGGARPKAGAPKPNAVQKGAEAIKGGGSPAE